MTPARVADDRDVLRGALHKISLLSTPLGDP